MTAEERKELPDSIFGIPESREFLMPDACHIRTAEACFRYAPEIEKPLLARHILLKAKEFGVDVRSSTILMWAKRVI